MKVDIRNAPIQEEDGDADAAIANVASTLRAVRDENQACAYVEPLADIP